MLERRDTNALRPMPRHSVGVPRYQPMRRQFETTCSCGATIAAANRARAEKAADDHHVLNRTAFERSRAMSKRHIKPSDYHLVDIVTGESHGGFVSLEAARAEARAAMLPAWQIFRGNDRLECHDPDGLALGRPLIADPRELVRRQ